MELKQLICLKEETEGILQKYNKAFCVKEFSALQELKAYVGEMISGEAAYVYEEAREMDSEGLCSSPIYRTEDITPVNLQECLLVAATDETIAWGIAQNIATLAYRNPNICGQTLSQTEILVEGFEEISAGFLEKAWQRYHHLPWTIAITKRCVIRELTLDDMEALFELYKDKELSRFTESLFDREEETDYQRAYINNMYRYFGYGIWLVFHKETGKLIGRAGLEHREYGEELELELGYLIGTGYQRQGYATEVCKAIIGYAKEEICALAVNCLIEEENTASIALAKKLGFAFLGQFQANEKNMLRFRIAFELEEEED
uniref:GNAT family N-acetyltransferase n=1 Tax=Agathobacter sp. TaxID=2021311 RepID=UPI00405704AA